MSAGYIVGDNTQLTAGGGQVLMDSYDVGYCQGKLGMSREVENLIVKTGVPKSTILQLPLGEDYNLEIPMLQVGNMDNLARVMGIPKITNDDTEVTVTMGGAAANVRTFAVRSGSTAQYIKLRENLTTLVVKNTAENVTYDVNDDYFIENAGTGYVVRNPGGAITSGQTVHCSYHYTPVEYEELLLGKTQSIINRQVEYLHISPVGGWLLHYCFWKCQGDGNIDLSLDTDGGAPMIALSKMKAMNDEANHPSSSTVGPTGFIRLVPSTLVTAYLATVTVL